MGYFLLLTEVPAPAVRITPRWRDKLRRKLSRVPALSQNIRGICVLYLRQKGVTSQDITERVRNGSPLEDYLPAVRLLNREGYQVLLTGDVELTPTLYREFGGMLADAKSLKIDERWFSLYALSEADIFVGENGGATHVPLINQIPCLILNVFPYFHGFPNSWMVYKTVRDQAGNLVHYDRIFSCHAFDYEIPGMTVHDNSSEEILQAVSSFLQDIQHGDQPDPNARVMARLPEHMRVRLTGARLSPAWLSLYQNLPKVAGKGHGS